VGAELLHADGWTDTTKLIVFFELLLAHIKKNSTFCPQIALNSLSQNKYRLFPHTVLTDFFDNQEGKCLLRGTS